MVKRKSENNVLGVFGISRLDPKSLDLMEICVGRYPKSKWTDLTVNQQAELIREALKPKQYLIDPHSRYMKSWDMVIILALVYTALVTPYEVGFTETQLDAHFWFNRFIDLIFLKDMVMQFFLKIQIHAQRGTVWIRDRKTIAKKYLGGWFCIDLISILPFEIVGLAVQDPAVQNLKIVRIIRLFRLLKLMRVLRASRLAKRWQDQISMSFSSQGLIKFSLWLLILAHWMACIWGMIGGLLGTNLICSGPDVVEIQDAIDGNSWITGRDWGPDSPCVHFDVYLSALHFSVMTITSIGYGDISPTRKEEVIVCVLMQGFGGLTWAYIIGSICGIIANKNPLRVAFEHSMDALNAMLAEQSVSQSLRLRLREYMREQQYHHFLLRARDISDHFSPALKGKLTLETAIGQAIKKVWYFSDCPDEFVVDLARILECAQFSPRDEVGGVGLLVVVERGSIARSGRILLPGNFWGEDMIMTSQFLIDPTKGIALSYVELLSVSKADLDTVTAQYPMVEKRIRKAAVSIAFRVAVRMLALEQIEQKKASVRRKLTQEEEFRAEKLHQIFNGLEEAEHAQESSPKSGRRASRAIDLISCEAGSPAVYDLHQTQTPPSGKVGLWNKADAFEDPHVSLNGVHDSRLIKKISEMLIQLQVGMNERMGQLEKGQDTIAQELRSLKDAQVYARASSSPIKDAKNGFNSLVLAQEERTKIPNLDREAAKAFIHDESRRSQALQKDLECLIAEHKTRGEELAILAQRTPRLSPRSQPSPSAPCTPRTQHA